MIAFFVANPMSSYYRSKTFEEVFSKISDNGNIFELKQKDSGLRIIARNVDSTSKALELLKKL